MDEEHVVGGTRIGWRDVPARVHDWVESELGSPIVDAVDERGGFSPGAATRLRGADGTRVFVKAVGDTLNPVSPHMHRREAALSAQLPMSSLLPALRATYDDGEWVALLFDEVDGRLPRLPWDDAELRRVVTAIEELHEVMTPCPVAHVPTMARRLEAEMSGWRTIAAGLGTDVALDDWARRHVGRLAALESQWAAAASGDTLLHGDIRVDNLLLTRDNVVFVDWANAGRGAPMFDIVAWAPTVVMQGGPAPEQLLAACPATARAEPDAVDAVVAAIAGYFVFQAAQPPPPGLPTVRAFQAAQGDVTLAWLRERTGWR